MSKEEHEPDFPWPGPDDVTDTHAPATLVETELDQDETTVATSERANKFHAVDAWCGPPVRNRDELALREAIEAGLGPCETCVPEETIREYREIREEIDA